MYSAAEKRQSCKYSKNSAASAQNEQINSKKWSFALLLLTNPLFYTIINNISMAVVAIDGLLSLTIWPQWVINHHGDFNDFDDFWILDDRNLKFQKNLLVQCKISKPKSVVFNPPWETPSFLLLWTYFIPFLHFNASRLLYYIKEEYREKESLKKSQIWWRNHCDRVRSRHGGKIPRPG